MKLEDCLRFDKATDKSFTKHRTENGTKGVWLVQAPLSAKDAELIGCKGLLESKFDQHKMGEEVEDCLIEFSTSGDVAPHEFTPEKVGKPTIEPLDGGRLLITLRIHVVDGHIAIIDEFFSRQNVDTFSLFVRPKQSSLFADQSTEPAPATYEPTPDEKAAVHEAVINGAPIKFEGKNSSAAITPVEVEGGYACDYLAAFTFRHPKRLPPNRTLLFAAESEAIEVAATSIHSWAKKITETEVAHVEKVAAGKLMQWCEERMPKSAFMPAEEPEEAQVVQ